MAIIALVVIAVKIFLTITMCAGSALGGAGIMIAVTADEIRKQKEKKK